MRKQRRIITALVLATSLLFTGCEPSEANKATTEVTNNADNFDITRELIIVNTRTDTVQCKLTGSFSLKMDSNDHQLEIITKTGQDEYRRDLFHINDDTNYYVHNVERTDWDDYRYEIIRYEDLYPEKLRTED